MFQMDGGSCFFQPQTLKYGKLTKYSTLALFWRMMWPVLMSNAVTGQRKWDSRILSRYDDGPAIPVLIGYRKITCLLLVFKHKMANYVLQSQNQKHKECRHEFIKHSHDNEGTRELKNSKKCWEYSGSLLVMQPQAKWFSRRAPCGAGNKFKNVQEF